jgi:uncharacterized membrane protein
MRYKLLGYIVWHAGGWYLRRRFAQHAQHRGRLALAAAGGVAVIGGALVARRRTGA